MKNGHKINGDDWQSLSIARKASLLGIGERQLHNYRARGCPINEGLEAIDEWRAANVADGRRNVRWVAKRRRASTVSGAMLDMVDEFLGCRDSLDIVLDRMRELANSEDDGGKEIWTARQWLTEELRLQLFCMFRQLPRCWKLGPKDQEQFEKWYAALDSIVGPIDPRDIEPEDDDELVASLRSLN